MGYKIEISESGKFLRLRVEGEVTVKLAREWSSELVEMSHAHDIKRFLCDMRNARNVSSVTDNFFWAYRDSDELRFERAARSAILTSPEDSSHDFVVLTKRNAGFNIKRFTDESSAVAWLEKENDH